MARTNVRNRHLTETTHEGAPIRPISPEQQLRRTVSCCLLWEDSYYESGVSVADRIRTLIAQVDPIFAQALAIDVRSNLNLRHVPLLMCRELARLGRLKAETLAAVIQRPDELAEFLAIYWKDGRQPLSSQVKKGLARAFTQFSAYQLAKYNQSGAGKVKLRDVLFLSHAKPIDEAQAATWKKLVDGTLEAPDTWEVALSAGADKKETFERLIREKKLGALALIRNLRNMQQAGADRTLVGQAILDADVSRVLPFRFISAAQHAPDYEPQLEAAMFRACKEGNLLLPGHTSVLIDVSGSMTGSPLSAPSQIRSCDAATALAMVLREVCPDVSIYIFATDSAKLPPRRGFGLRAEVGRANQNYYHGVSSEYNVGHGTNIGEAVKKVLRTEPRGTRVVVITDGQSHDPIPDVPGGYILNVASYKNGVGFGPWTMIDGWSEGVIRFMMDIESLSPSQE